MFWATPLTLSMGLILRAHTVVGDLPDLCPGHTAHFPVNDVCNFSSASLEFEFNHPPPRMMVLVSNGRSGSTVIGDAIGHFTHSKEDSHSFAPELFGSSGQQIKQNPDPCGQMVRYFCDRAWSIMTSPKSKVPCYIGFKWKPFQDPADPR